MGRPDRREHRAKTSGFYMGVAYAARWAAVEGHDDLAYKILKDAAMCNAEFLRGIREVDVEPLISVVNARKVK